MTKGTRPFKWGGAGRRRDSSESVIVNALKADRCSIYYVGGRNLPDILIFDHLTKAWLPMGIKTPGAELTEAEAAGVPWPLVSTVDEALRELWARRPGVRYGRG